jgi:hypothetical protein
MVGFTIDLSVQLFVCDPISQVWQEKSMLIEECKGAVNTMCRADAYSEGVEIYKNIVAAVNEPRNKPGLSN